eukprot:9356747-Alexandrium_andersonii.AAC.1
MLRLGISTSKIPAVMEVVLQWLGLFVGHLAHLLHGNGGWKGGKSARGAADQGAGGSSGGGGDRRSDGHNPAWQSGGPR